MSHSKVPELGISLRSWSRMPGSDSGLPAFTAGEATRDSGIAALERYVVNDLLPMNLLHLAHDRVVLPCQKVVIALVIPIIPLLPKQSEGDKVGGEIGAEGDVLEAQRAFASIRSHDIDIDLSVAENRYFPVAGD